MNREFTIDRSYLFLSLTKLKSGLMKLDLRICAHQWTLV